MAEVDLLPNGVTKQEVMPELRGNISFATDDTDYNTMVMEKDCSGSLDARHARWRCTKCKHKWERWIIGTTWMMTGEVAGDGFLLTKQ